MHDAVAPFRKIQDYAIIGDSRAAALVARNGSIDWLCWPKFDSPAVFSAILDPERGGFWRITPRATFTTQRRYVPHTNVLQTEFNSNAGSARLTDLMPVASEEYKKRIPVADHELLRRVECTSGEVDLEMQFIPRPHFGQSRPLVREAGSLGLRMESGRGVHWLRSTVPLDIGDDSVSARVALKRGESAQFSLSYAEESPAILPCLGAPAEERIRISVDWWERWAERISYEGDYREAVVRSALALKLLTYAPSGAIVAAPTTSLPETVGGDRNWDYRFCWLRDASLTVRALTGLGYWDEAEAFLAWMLHSTRLTQPRLRVLYTLFGENPPVERELPYLRGYRDSRPVRTGNGARDQVQMDVYGEVVDAAAQFAFHGHRFDRMTQKVLIEIGKYVAGHWQMPDEGIWEPRSEGRMNHTHSRVLCWVVLDRLCRLAKQGLLRAAPVSLFERECGRVVRDIRENAWNQRRNTYVKAIGSTDVDASLLLMAWYGFEHADSDRMRATWRMIDHDLRAGPGLLYRYRTEPGEGAFGICSFWEVEYFALGGGTLNDARRAFETLLSYTNDVGLYAEEIDPGSGDALGNFPQAFTHVGLISAALSIEERARGARQLAHRPEAAGRPVQEGTTR